jgi:pimeloyl-ACP methyl ester carboxylesterase
MSRLVYLHGFASGPASRKAQFFQERLAELGIGLEIPDLAEGDFSRLTLSGQLRVVERASRGGPVVLIGSSMGGYLAALYASRHPEVEKLALLAPAFSFSSRWLETLGQAAAEEWERTGVLKVFHYGEGREMPLGHQIIEDALQYEAYPHCAQPTIIFHGKKDRVVPPEYSAAFAGQNPSATLHLMESGHELTDVLDDIWMEMERFLF